MSLHRHAARRDANEKGLVELLEASGATIWRLSGKALPDLLIRYRGSWAVCEVKTRKGRLTKAQAAIPWPVIRSDAEAQQLLRDMVRRSTG